MRCADALEVVTTLGDSIVELTVAHDRAQLGAGLAIATPTGWRLGDQALPRGTVLQFPCGRGTTVATVVACVRPDLPRPGADLRVRAYLAASLALQLLIVAIALRETVLDTVKTGGTPQRGLVANRASMARGAPAPVPTPSIEVGDQRTKEPAATPTVGQHGEQPHTTVPLPSKDPAHDGHAQKNTDKAKNVEPCMGLDCGIVATGDYTTTNTGHAAGEDYALAPRQARGLSQSVVTCDPDAGCSTVSGEDQGEIRAEIGHHVAELDACFAKDPRSGSVIVDIQIDDRGSARVVTHDKGAVAQCVAGVVGSLAFPGGERGVTLAFARN